MGYFLEPHPLLTLCTFMREREIEQNNNTYPFVRSVTLILEPDQTT